MAKILKGAPVADAIKESIIYKVEECLKAGIAVKMAIVRVGERADDLSYEKRVIKYCAEMGISSEVFVFPEDITTESFFEAFEKINNDDKIHGILVFRPLPKQLDLDIIQKKINPEKDIDCMNPANLNNLFGGDMTGMLPCTAEAVIEVLKYYDIELTGAKVAIVNRSMVLGKPLAMMLLSENATVTICHSKTKGMKEITKALDIIVTGVGHANYFNNEYFSDKSVVVDVGINFVDGKMNGDVDYKSAEELVAAITPVPGGIGAVTSMILLKHVALAAERKVND